MLPAMVCLAMPPGCAGQNPANPSDAIAMSAPTSDRLHQAGWWPTKTDAPRGDYAGTAACVKCHGSIAESYKNMAMSHASEPAANAIPLRRHGELQFQSGPYKYSVVSSGESVTYKVSDGKQAVSHALVWAFGAGHLGQTYVYRDGDKFFESHVSYYAGIDGLDITTGHARGVPENLEAAAGRRMYSPETSLCFLCHTTGSFDANKFDPAGLTNGVTCEACHGPAANHVAAERAGMAEGSGAILNPGKFDRAEAVDFCGACHRTTGDVIENGWVDIGVMNARFQPYRLQKSRCWESGDAKFACNSCHDAHRPLVHDAAAYDAACLRCHVTVGTKATVDRPGAACKVSQNNCITCHMPEYELPGAHSTFRDHYIRVVKSGEPYPN
jgi:hypothetical protein